MWTVRVDQIAIILFPVPAQIQQRHSQWTEDTPINNGIMISEKVALLQSKNIDRNVLELSPDRYNCSSPSIWHCTIAHKKFNY